jgi:hypothetical protein
MTAARRGLDTTWLFAGHVMQFDEPNSRMRGSASLGTRSAVPPRSGIATGQMDTAQGIVPLVVKNCF